MSNELKTTQESTSLEESDVRFVAKRPAVDILEDEHEFLLLADMPAIDTSQLIVRLEKETLTLSGRSMIEGFAPVEYERSFRVMKGLDPESVSAEYKQGVLAVHLPKPASHRPRRIQVQEG
jgi:HSP20 family molecular chaperone IbpA